MTRAERYAKNAEREKAAYHEWYQVNSGRRCLTERRRYWTQRYYKATGDLNDAVMAVGEARMTLDAIDTQLGEL